MLKSHYTETMETTFRIGPIRPPSEADSLLLQVTQGCTWNKCKFCQLYKGTQFRTFTADSIRADIDNMAVLAQRVCKYGRNGHWDIDGLNDELMNIRSDQERQCFYMMANWILHGAEHVFLQDGNSTILRGGKLSEVLVYLRQTFPTIKRITSYGRAENLSKLSVEDFIELKEAGLDRIHSGFETGSDAVLALINKGVTQEQQIHAGQHIKAGGIELSIYFMPGVGGRPLTESNAVETAKVVNAVNPDFLRIRTYTAKYGTQMYEEYQAGTFEACSDEEKLLEIRKVIELTQGVDTRIVSDHIVNLLQNIEGSLVNDKARLLGIADEYLQLSPDEKRLYQAARRNGLVTQVSDLQTIGASQRAQLQRISRQYPDQHSWERYINSCMERYV